MYRRSSTAQMRFIPTIARTWLTQQIYGWPFAPTIDNFDGPYTYAKALLFAAGGDEVAPSERQHVIGLVEVLMTSSNDEDQADLLTLVQHWSSSPGDSATNVISAAASSTEPMVTRIMLYDAVNACCADDTYDPLEKANVAKVSTFFSVPRNRLRQIEELALREVALRKRKVDVLSKKRRAKKQ